MNLSKHLILVFILFLVFFLFGFAPKALGATCSGGAFQTYTTYQCRFVNPKTGYTCDGTSHTIWQGCFWLSNICLHSVPASEGCHATKTSCSVTPGSPGGGTSSSGCVVTNPTPTPTPVCNPGEWGACGSHSCGACYSAQCNGSGTGWSCVFNPGGCCPGPSPSCTISLSPNPASVPAGAGVTISATTTQSNGTISQVNFTSSNTGVTTVTTPDASSPFTTTATGVANGTATVTATAIMSGNPTCSNTATVNVTPPGPWWQVKDADISAGGNLVSLIPSSCILPGCNPIFDLNGVGGYPGVPAYAGTNADFAAGTGTGTVSSTGWLANSGYLGKTYDYAYFSSLIPPTVTMNEITPNGSTVTVNQGYFSSQGSASPRGFYWFHHQGDLIMNGEPNLGSRKAIVLVEGGDLYVNGRIGLTAGSGFFMAIVGKDATGGKGNIIVDPTVSHPNQPGLEGVFFAENQFKTGAGSNQLWVRGMVTAEGGVALQRDLGASDANTPAELFEYAPDLIFTYPREFVRHGYVWKEIAP